MHAFLSSYHHPKNVAYSRGGGYNNALVPPSKYAAAHGPHRQAQVDKELRKILKGGGPAKSKDGSKIHLTVTPDRIFIFHHHHHPCIKFRMPHPNPSASSDSRFCKWKLLWWWSAYETATDERVMKAVMSGLSAINGGDDFWEEENEAEVLRPVPVDKVSQSEKRKRAATAASERTNTVKKLKEDNISTATATASDAESDTRWACSTCTFINENPLGLACEICNTERSLTTS
ncbi:hypothetical protein TrVE_jg11568 [Triparma verrucosa]|uniref:RanBP2-type domain-containing protein n=1 Tax=Triparma verrucosa TaxID=1606542 RepID=A0A9W7BI95_9STRA|nr:hypothetical protein TrVE_jg11568 [Triparma verrucosa]